MQNDHNIAVTHDRSEVLTWLSPLKPHLRHHDLQKNRIKDVGNWILDTEEFRSWRNGDGQGESQKAAIFCSGNLGVGKTYISSLVIDTLCDELGGGGEDIAVACFYFDSTAQKEQSAAGLFGALLRQIVGGFTQIPKEIKDEFQRYKKYIGGRKPQLPEIVKMLGSCSSTQRTFLCLDGVDECSAPDRADILLSLEEIIQTSPTTRVFLTGRPHVGDEVEKRFLCRAAFLSIGPRIYDNTRYIQKRLAQDATSDEMDWLLEVEIMGKIMVTASEIFLLMSLSLDAVLEETTIHRRRERLDVIPDALILGDTYGPTLGRIEAQGGHKSKLAMSALMWICHSETPLGAEELCQALAVEIGSIDCNANNAPSIRTVLSCCQGLVVLDKERSVVRHIHHTLQEYLTRHRNLFDNPHSTIAETCLTYLNSQQVMALSGSSVQSTQHPPFLAYSSVYWGAHMRKELTDRGKALALKLLSRYECHISIGLLLEHMLGRHRFSSLGHFHLFTGLHCASIFGLVEVFTSFSIVVDDISINCMDGTGATPFLWAAMRGHEGLVKLLLGQEHMDPTWADCSGRTPMSWAAGNGHEAVVKLLLAQNGLSPDKPDFMDRISLMTQNITKRHPKLFPRQEAIDPDTPDLGGRTPMSWAAGNGQEAVVKILLGRKDVNPDMPDIRDRAPISWAAKNGYEVVVELLLERGDVNPDRLAVGGKTPISLAAKNGHEAVVKLLLAREDVNPGRPDDEDRTPISLAAERGHEAVVKLLLERGDVNPDWPDKWGQTPIMLAVQNDHEAVVLELFLRRQDGEPDWPDVWA